MSTPLHLAAAGAHKKVISLIVSKDRMTLQATNVEGRTPLNLAEEHEHTEVYSDLAY